MTKPLPHQWLPGADVSNSLAQAVQENFDSFQTTDEGPRARPSTYGTVTLNFVANNDASASAAHGLNGTPAHVFLTSRSAGTSSIASPAWSADATNVTIQARTYNGVNATITVVVDWMAVL